MMHQSYQHVPNPFQHLYQGASPPPAYTSRPSSSGIDSPLIPSHPYFRTRYVPVEHLSSTPTGTVLKCRVRRDGVAEEFVAVKIIPKYGLDSEGRNRKLVKVQVKHRYGSEDIWRDSVIPLEAYAMRHLHHRRVIKYHDLFFDENYFYLVSSFHGNPWHNRPPDYNTVNPSRFQFETHRSRYRRILSLPPAGPDLGACLGRYGALPEHLVGYIFAQIVESVQYLVDRGVIHGELKEENFLISKNWEIKIADFGTAVMFNPVNNHPPLLKLPHSCSGYAAPEGLSGQWYDPKIADIYSMGVMLYRLLLGRFPFPPNYANSPTPQTLPPVAPFNYQGKPLVSPMAWDLISRCLECNPDKRITLEKMWLHPFLRSWFERPL